MTETKTLMPVTDPMAFFARWFEEAQHCGLREPTAMNLATAGRHGRPSSRMILLKGHDSRGFSFYTNLGSRKAGELVDNPYAALCFYWMPQGRQVRAEGEVRRVSDAEADAYFASRRRESRIGAWASEQSRALGNMEDLRRRVAEKEAEFKGQEVPRPEFWGGFRLVPMRIEFWQEGDYRLHERLVYTRKNISASWETVRLFP